MNLYQCKCIYVLVTRCTFTQITCTAVLSMGNVEAPATTLVGAQQLSTNSFKMAPQVDPKTSVSFTLNGEAVVVDNCSPYLSLNDWLRSQPGLSGTKKMCGEGGCGCCVVTVNRLDPGALEESTISINSVSFILGLVVSDTSPVTHTCTRSVVYHLQNVLLLHVIRSSGTSPNNLSFLSLAHSVSVHCTPWRGGALPRSKALEGLCLELVYTPSTYLACIHHYF